MASTTEMFLAGLALIVNTVVIFILYYVCSIFLGPFVQAITKLSFASSGPLTLGSLTYIVEFVFALLLIFEIILVIAFIVVVGRRTTYDEYY